MKKIFYIIALLSFLSINLFAQLVNPGDTTGTLITAAIRPNSQADDIATAYTNEIRGGIKHYEHFSELADIKPSRLVDYMLATVADSAGKLYQFTGLEWVELSTGAAGEYLDNFTGVTLYEQDWGSGRQTEGFRAFIPEMSGKNGLIQAREYAIGVNETEGFSTMTATDSTGFGLVKVAPGRVNISTTDGTRFGLVQVAPGGVNISTTGNDGMDIGRDSTTIFADNLNWVNWSQAAIDSTPNSLITKGYGDSRYRLSTVAETDPVLAQYLYVSSGLDSSLYLSSTRPPTAIQKDGTTLIGNRSGLFSTDLRWSTGVGNNALKSNDAYCITAVGASAGRNIASGSNFVVAMGTYAGDNHSGGGTSVFIGDGAGKNSVGLSQTFVGTSAGENVNRNYINGIGAGAFKNATFQANSVGVAYGTSSGYGATNLKNVVFIGNNSGNTSTGTNLTYLGISAGYKSSSNFTTAVGTSAFYKGTGDRSTYLGAGAGQLTTGGNNIAIGALTLSHSGTHYNNIIIGNQTDTLTQYRTNYDSLIIIGNYIVPTADKQAIFGGSYTKDVILKGTGIPKFNSDTLATLAQVRSIFPDSSWQSIYADTVYTKVVNLYDGIYPNYGYLNAIGGIATLSGFNGFQLVGKTGNYIINNSDQTTIRSKEKTYFLIDGVEKMSIQAASIGINESTTFTDNIIYNNGTLAAGKIIVSDNAGLMSWQWENPITAQTTATPSIDFGYYSNVINLSVTANVVFQPTTNSSSANSRVITIKLQADAVAHNLSFPAAWLWAGGKPTQILANGTGILTLQNFGTGDAAVVASYVLLSNGE